jgi:beta-1,4-mannosyl-glycoprotein beta-1,4-N-acetylglucosaminyltransferase
MEHKQRGAIITACDDFSDDDILIMGDVDEIPSLEAIEWAKDNTRLLPIVCQQHIFYYNLRHLRQEIWCGSIFSTLRTARIIGTQELRNRRYILTRIGNAGWHLSYFYNADGIRRKLESYSHQEYNLPEFKNKEHINNCCNTGEDLFKKNIQTIKVEHKFFPLYFREAWSRIGIVG